MTREEIRARIRELFTPEVFAKKFPKLARGPNGYEQGLAFFEAVAMEDYEAVQAAIPFIAKMNT